MKSRFQKVGESGLPYIVAVNGDRVLGYAYCTPFRDRFGYRYVVEDSVYVAAYVFSLVSLLVFRFHTFCLFAVTRAVLALAKRCSTSSSIAVAHSASAP